MKKFAYFVSLISLCMTFGSSFAADAKTAAPAAATPAANTAPAQTAAAEPAVKKSKASICHDKTSPGYKQTKNFTEFKTMDECIKSGGRAPKGSK
jgi:hypothetical protein